MESCAYPDPALGVVLRLSTYLDCQARALGENGFQALVGGPIVAGLLSALVTVFVALVGYRLILGQQPDLRDGVVSTVRLGMVLALVTGWPAFQTLVYRVAVDGPVELAAVLLPASGLPVEGIEARVQQAYDTLRLGGADAAQPPPAGNSSSGDGPQGQAAATPLPPVAAVGPYAQPALPQTATIFAATTIGIISALRIAVGVLLALAPLAILGLLFDATLGLFSGWVRALAGAALGVVAASVSTSLDLLLVEGELGNWQAIGRGVTVIDPGGLTTIVLCFVPVMALAVWATFRMAGAFRLSWRRSAMAPVTASSGAAPWITANAPAMPSEARSVGTPLSIERDRAHGIADALAATVHREQTVRRQQGSGVVSSTASAGRPGERTQPAAATAGAASRRTGTRRSGSAARRDRA